MYRASMRYASGRLWSIPTSARMMVWSVGKQFWPVPMLNIHPLQAALEALATEVPPTKVAECLRLLGPDGRICCPVCMRDLIGAEIPGLVVSGKVFTCSNPKCSATGNVVHGPHLPPAFRDMRPWAS